MNNYSKLFMYNSLDRHFTSKRLIASVDACLYKSYRIVDCPFSQIANGPKYTHSACNLVFSSLRGSFAHIGRTELDIVL